MKNKTTFLFLIAAMMLLICSIQVSFSQGRDRSKFILGYIDTSKSGIDTSLADTTRIRGPVDSTARVNNFKYSKDDEPLTSFGDYKSSILLYGSSYIEYKVTFDSLNNAVITESINGENIKVPLVIPLEKYIELRSRLKAQDIFYNIVAEKYQIETTDDLEKLFKGITEIEIPLPFETETIFGPPTINLKINGIIDITASYQRSSNDLSTITQQNQNQNNINFKQEVQVTTKGTVGDKLTIDADWNSQRTFEFENQLKLKYTGYPDEVIQLIEAGNVSLDTRSNLIGSTQALFGVKAQFKLGPLTLTTIASQKKSEKKEVNVNGGAVETPFEVPIYRYSETNYLLDESFGPIFESYQRNGIKKLEITDIEVWVKAEQNNPNRRLAICTDTMGNRPTAGYGIDSLPNINGHILNGFFKKLSSEEFTLNKYSGYITIDGNIQNAPNDAIAVSYKMIDSNGVATQHGDFSNNVVSNAKLILKLLRYESQQPPTQDTAHAVLWSRMMKNIYHIDSRNILNDPNNVEFNIYYTPPSETSTPNYTGSGPYGSTSWMFITGVDYRRNGNPSDSIFNGDNIFDFFPTNTIDLENGNIIFPYLEPFGKNFTSKAIDSVFKGTNQLIYTSSKNTVAETGGIRFTLKGKAKGTASSRYSLGFNLVEGSVKVFNGTVELAAGVDYSIDYSLGELIILNAAALQAGSNLKITYESNDLFQLASKTLLGTRAELQINKTSYIGFTLINLKQQTLNDKIRIGEEPTNNTIIGFDASTDIKTNFLTRLVNKIPGYNTKEESILNLKGEIAFMLPDPNTKKSQIPSDNGESIAYIDDFEGVKKLIPLGLNPLSWVISSMPMDSTLIPGNTQLIMDSLMSLKRGKLNWYNLLNNVPINEVYPNKSIATNQNQSLTPLVFDIIPSQPGQYNFVTDAQYNTLNPNKRNTWSGIFKFLNTSQTNLRDENINYIEIWMQINPTGGNSDSAKMIIDLGSISERIVTSSILKPRSTSGYTIDYHTEDKDLSGTLNEGEDVGIDGYSTIEEQQLFNNAGLTDLGALEDPSRDNYFWVQGSSDYSKFNGTELNATNLTEAKKIDTEDLNNNGTLNTENNYFEYVIPLDTSKFRNHPYIAGGGNAGWYQFIIPLDQYKKAIGNATLTNIQYARVWFKGFDDNAQIKIVDFNLVGNQWIKQNKNDTSYSVSVVNIEDNPDYRTPVPGDYLRQRDQSQVDQNVLSNEQSLSVEVRDLLPGQGKYVFKSFITRPIDLINYRILKLFVNGDSTFRYINPDIHDASMVVRLGTDTSNYYEYKAPIHPDKRPGTPWETLNEVIINLTEMTAVKQKRDSTTGNIVYTPVINGQPGAVYGVVGNPSIRDIKTIALGILNTSSDPIITRALTGSVWFNEMRVLKTNDESGYAYTLSAGLKIADLGQLNFSYNKTDPNFHNLEGRFGNLVLANSWELSGTINAHKILNALLSKYVSVKFKDFFTIPVSFSHLEVIDKPRYLSGTDVDLETAAQRKYEEILALDPNNKEYAEYSANQIRIASQTLKIVNRFSITGMKFTFPGENYFVKEFLNKLEMNFVRNSYTERTPTLERRYAWDWNTNIGLNSDIGLLDIVNLKIGKFLPLGEEFKNAKLYFFFPFMPLAPLYTSNINLKGSMNRKRGDEKLRNQFNPSPTSRQFDAQRGFTMNWKFIENWVVDLTGDYSFNSGSDLTYLETLNDSLRTARPEGEIIDDILFNNGIINWGKDLDYSQTVSMNPKINIPGLRDFIDFSTTYRVTYGWRASNFSNTQGSNVGYNSDWQSTAYLRLNSIFSLFKGGDKILGGAYQDDQKPGDILKLLKGFIPDQITLNYGQTKLLTNQGVTGRPGFGNFWMQLNSQENLGPSRLYQLGWTTDPGSRIPLSTLTDVDNINNSISLNTFINPIFPDNLKINFTYKTTLAKNKTFTYNSDLSGIIGTPTNISESKTITRPSFVVSGDILNKLARPFDATTQAKEIAESFENNLVSFPFPSWNLTLNGIEKFEMFKNIAQSITLESGYSSEYKRVMLFDGRNPEYINSQSLTSGFTPLIGVNFNFKEVAEGSLTATFKLSKTDNYSMDPIGAKLTNTATNDISINATFTKSGFTLPLFGLSLDNNITISFSFTRTKNDPVVYSYDPLTAIWNTNTQNGSTSTTINPSIQYNLSRSVTLQLFYKYNKIEPTGNNLLITTRTSNEAGLNIRLQIQ